MTQGILVAVVAAIFAYLLMGAKRPVYLLYCLGIVPFVTLEMDSGGLVDGGGLGNPNTLFKMSLRLLTTTGFLYYLFARRRSFAHVWRLAHLPVLFFVAWGLLSTVRSTVPLISILRLGELLVFFLGGIVLCTDSLQKHGPRKVARWHCLAFIQILIATITISFLDPDLALHVSADGIGRLGHKFINANSLGFACVVVGLWATAELRVRREGERGIFFERVVPLIALCLAAYVLYQTRSRTALITMTLGQMILWFPAGSRRFWSFPSFIFISFAVILFAAQQSDTVAEWMLRGASVADLQTATGRVGLWDALLGEQLPQAPILGAGYLMLGSDGSFFYNGTYWSNAHNTYVFALIASGIPGFLAIVTIALAPAWLLLRKTLRAHARERSFWALLFALQLVVVISGLTGFGISGFPNPAMYFHYSLFGFAMLRARPRGAEATKPEAAWRPSPLAPRAKRAV